LDNAVAITIRDKVGERRDGVVAGSLQDHAGRVAGTFFLILLLKPVNSVLLSPEELGNQCKVVFAGILLGEQLRNTAGSKKGGGGDSARGRTHGSFIDI
jgi:hypothetical protein